MTHGKNVSINDVFPLKAAQRNTHQRPDVDGFIYIHYPASPYSARISVIYFVYFLPFDKIWLGSVCLVQRLAMKLNAKFTEGE